MTNAQLAQQLRRTAALLDAQGANPFRAAAYRRAADTVAELRTPLINIVRDEGPGALDDLPGIGPRLARALADAAQSGRLAILERLEAAVDPVSVLRSVPGIGAALAERLHDELGIGSLEELELAAHDGRLQAVEGFGPRRVAAVQAAVAARLGRRPPAPRTHEDPPVAELLDVDAEYRRGAEQGILPTIAPRRFNPSHEAWLPVLHARRGTRHYTALYSNTARAHQLGTTRDWVVIYLDGPDGERQFTVVTGRAGRERGRRVVRGREAESLAVGGAADR